MQPVRLNFWVLKSSIFKNQQENALSILRVLEHNLDKINKSTAICNLLVLIFRCKKAPYSKINKSTVICNQYFWIFGSDTRCYLQNQQINSSTAQQLNSSTAQQINKSTAQQVNKSTVQRLNRSTNQQWSATSSSEFLGLTHSVIYKINKSTGKRAINTQRLGRNPW